MKKLFCVLSVIALSGCGSSSNSAPAGPVTGNSQPLSCQELAQPSDHLSPVSDVVDGRAGTYVMTASEVYFEVQFTDGKRVNFILNSSLNNSWNTLVGPTPDSPVMANQKFSCQDLTQIGAGHAQTAVQLPAVIDRATGKVAMALKFMGEVYKCATEQGGSHNGSQNDSATCGPTLMSAARETNVYPDLSTYIATPRPGHDFSVKLRRPDPQTLEMYVMEAHTAAQGQKIKKVTRVVYTLQ